MSLPEWCAAVMRDDAASEEVTLLDGAAMVGSGNAAPS